MSLWPQSTQAAWKHHLTLLKASFDTALQHPTSLNLFNATWAFLTAPSIALSPLFSESPKPPVFTSPDASVNAALQKVLLGQERKAAKLLSSFGIAPATSAVIDAIRALHPDRPEPLSPPP